MAEQFRTCPTTGLKIHQPAEMLIRVNAVAAVVCLLVGGLAALLILLTRWPAIHLLNEEWFYRLLTAHALDMLIAWIIFFEVAGLYFGATVLLNNRLPAPKVGWVAFILMLVGGALINYTVLVGQATVAFTSYVPLKASPVYYLGVILFAVGTLTAVLHFFAALVVAKKEKTYEGSLPMVTFGLMCAAVIAVLTLLHGAAIYIPTFLWSLGIIPSVDPMIYRLVWWSLGHPSQQINVCAMVAMWYLIATLTTGAKPLNEKLCRTGFLLYVLFINVASEHHLLVDPALSIWHKIVNTSYVMHLAVLASMIHAFAIPAMVEVALRKKGFTKGLFEWLKKAPWGNPAFASMFISLIGFGFVGGITGVTFGTEQISIIRHNTWSITGHFHGTVVLGTTLAFMGITYYIVPLIFRRQIFSETMAKLSPYFFGGGVFIFASAMMFAGGYGVPRRHWDITFAGASIPFQFDPTVFFFMALTGLGGLLAIVGGALYVLNTVASVFIGKKIQ